MKWISLLVVLICLTFEKQTANSAKIIGVFQVPAKSHYILGASLLRPLAERGHEITMISPYTLDEPHKNFKEIIIEGIEQISKEQIKGATNPNATKVEVIQNMGNALYLFAEMFWKSSGVQEFIRKKEKYDLLIIDATVSDSILALGHYFDIPTIIFDPVGSFSVVNKYVNNPDAVYSSGVFIPLPDETVFLNRLANVLVNLITVGLVNYYVYPWQEDLLNTYLPNSPKVQDLVYNVSLVLSNSHYSLETPRPYVPNFIQIGGFRTSKTKPLPEEFRKFLDNAKKGVVLFCLGSNLRVGDIDEWRLKAIVQGLNSLAPMKVLFKSEIDVPNVQSHIKVSKWIPQSDILAHPNIKAFITHGGMGGISESVSHGVPTLAIPFFGDQENNVAEAVKLGITVELKYNNLNDKTFSAALHEVLSNPKYLANAQLRSKLMKDQPIDPLEKAIFWIEHVIKYKGAPHLRNAGMKLTWYQNYMIDIILFITGLISIVLFILYKILSIVLRLVLSKVCRNKSNVKVKTS